MSRRRDRNVVAVVLPALVLTVLLTITVEVERAAPVVQLDPATEQVLDTDPPALPEDHRGECQRHADDVGPELLREEVRAGGRISSEMVLGCPLAFDGIDVVYIGEVVGDVLRRDGGAWLQVNDDDYALRSGPLAAHRERAGSNSGLSVWADEAALDVLSRPGGPGRRGDVVRVEATFHRSDPLAAGGVTLRAAALEVLVPGVDLVAPFHLVQAIAAGLAVLTAVAVGVALRRSRRR